GRSRGSAASTSTPRMTGRWPRCCSPIRQSSRTTMRTDRLALYTTVYPAVERYLGEWYASVLEQSDRDFDLWIGVDAMTLRRVCAAFGAEPTATWIMAEAHDSPTQIRLRAIDRMLSG